MRIAPIVVGAECISRIGARAFAEAASGSRGETAAQASNHVTRRKIGARFRGRYAGGRSAPSRTPSRERRRQRQKQRPLQWGLFMQEFGKTRVYARHPTSSMNIRARLESRREVTCCPARHKARALREKATT